MQSVQCSESLVGKNEATSASNSEELLIEKLWLNLRRYCSWSFLFIAVTGECYHWTTGVTIKFNLLI
jgi:hypothetical protein